jgi:hypothetical protein
MGNLVGFFGLLPGSKKSHHSCTSAGPTKDVEIRAHFGECFVYTEVSATERPTATGHETHRLTGQEAVEPTNIRVVLERYMMMHEYVAAAKP